MTQAKSYKTHNDLPAEVREQMNALLNQHLADTFDLYSQTKQAHWNVKGMHFIQLHELFDKLADEVLDFIDTIAERVTALGGTALGTARMSAASSRLTEYPDNLVEGSAVVSYLVSTYAAQAASTREAIDAADKAGDKDTADLFTEVSRGLDKALWFLEAHLQA